VKGANVCSNTDRRCAPVSACTVPSTAIPMRTRPCAPAARSSHPRRRFAAILVDVFYDHFLACHWTRYADLPLEDFTQQVYATLLPDIASYPERLQRILPRMRQTTGWVRTPRSNRWTPPARHRAALPALCTRCRAGRSVQELLDHYAALEQHFLDFFPELLGFVETNSATRNWPKQVRRRVSGSPDAPTASGTTTPQRPTAAELRAARGRRVPGIVAPSLNILFIGINPGSTPVRSATTSRAPATASGRRCSAPSYTAPVHAPEERELLKLGSVLPTS